MPGAAARALLQWHLSTGNGCWPSPAELLRRRRGAVALRTDGCRSGRSRFSIESNMGNPLFEVTDSHDPHWR